MLVETGVTDLKLRPHRCYKHLIFAVSILQFLYFKCSEMSPENAEGTKRC